MQAVAELSLEVAHLLAALGDRLRVRAAGKKSDILERIGERVVVVVGKDKVSVIFDDPIRPDTASSEQVVGALYQRIAELLEEQEEDDDED